MCGIVGFIDFQKTLSNDIVIKMANSIQHRGPDDSGVENFSTNHANISMGFRRLAIIELSPLGHQPMFSDDKKICITFNGEIYNFLEIKSELEALGFNFKTKSDTEVIIQSFKKWGIKCIDKFIGMFSIAIYDLQNEIFYLVRDRAGVKPLYIGRYNDSIIYSSELKAFHHHPHFTKVINKQALSLFLQHGYIPAPYSIFEGTEKLEPGNFLEINLQTKKISKHCYWSVSNAYNKPKLKIEFEEAKKETEKILKSAFEYRMIADVPVGIFLSGGYDSTAVTALLQKDRTTKLKTFTIGFEEKEFNEASYAKKVADYLGTEHNSFICSPKDALDIIPLLPEIYDEPFGDISAIPTTLVSRYARQQVTVALSADAGDEIFAGYQKYFNSLATLNKINKVPSFVKLLASYLKNKTPIYTQNKFSKLEDFLNHPDPIKRFQIISQAMTFFETKRLIKDSFEQPRTSFDNGSVFSTENDNLSLFQAIEYQTYLADDILHKVDRATMSVSLEGREPFLDHRLIEWVATLPTEYKYQNGVGKFILKDIVHQYVPKSIMHREKMGFGIPLEKWFKNELKSVLNDYLNSEQIKKQGIFNHTEIQLIKEKFFADEKIEFQRLSYLFIFQLWYEKWFNN